jgi:hypothetical protein
MHEVRIEMTGPGRGKVFVDGQELRCSEVAFHAKVDSPNTVAVRLLTSKITVTGPAQVISGGHTMRRKRTVNWLFVAVATAAVLFALFGLPRLGALGWIGGAP